MFDLEIAIKKWLKQFSKHRAFDDGSVREMELHLRDHIDDLIANGHSEEKAFNLAVNEFGEVSHMAKEEFTNTLPAQRFHYVGMYKNYLRVAQAYMLISMPTHTSAIIGVFQVMMRCSFLC